jgi:hypothetical protein
MPAGSQPQPRPQWRSSVGDLLAGLGRISTRQPQDAVRAPPAAEQLHG